MVALDQREALRAMLAEHRSEPVTDQQLTDFKLLAGRLLAPHASAVLVDKPFALDRFIAEGTVGSSTALIAAADVLLPRGDELVGDVELDVTVDPKTYRDLGVAALKLLVLYRPDGDSAARLELVDRFVARCREAGVLSIVEPVSRPPLGGGAWSWDEGVLHAAAELGDRGADLYKAEVPLHGQGPEDDIRERCARLSSLIASPWVVLSSGVPPARFARAVELACEEGASGFLAGRAVWRSCLAAADLESALIEDAVPRLQELAATVDRVVGRRGQT